MQVRAEKVPEMVQFEKSNLKSRFGPKREHADFLNSLLQLSLNYPNLAGR